MLPHTFVRHRSAETLVKAFMGKKRVYVDVLRGRHTHADWLKTIKSHGFWGFVRISRGKAVIHWWASEDAPVEDVVHLLSHELGHISFRQEGDAVMEEVRADSYADVAVEVHALVAGLGVSSRSGPGRGGTRRGRRRSRTRGR